MSRLKGDTSDTSETSPSPHKKGGGSDLTCMYTNTSRQNLHVESILPSVRVARLHLTLITDR